MPLGLLVGALALLVHHRARARRPRRLPREEPLPPPRRRDGAARARGRRRRGDAALDVGWRTVVVVAVLVVGDPGNLNVIVNYMHRRIVKNQIPYKAMMLSLPRVADREGGAARRQARAVPRPLRHDRLAARRRRRRAGSRSRRTISPAERGDGRRCGCRSGRSRRAARAPATCCVDLATAARASTCKPGKRIVVRRRARPSASCPRRDARRRHRTRCSYVTVGGSTLVARAPGARSGWSTSTRRSRGLRDAATSTAARAPRARRARASDG